MGGQNSWRRSPQILSSSLLGMVIPLGLGSIEQTRTHEAAWFVKRLASVSIVVLPSKSQNTFAASARRKGRNDKCYEVI